DELLCVVPADVGHWTIAAPPSLVWRTKLATRLSDASVPLRESDIAAADSEVLVDADVVDGLLARLCVRAHIEFAQGYDDELRAVRAIAEQFTGEALLVGLDRP